MTPLPVNPTVVIRVHELTGQVIGVSSNIAPDLKVVIAITDKEFEIESANKPFKVDDKCVYPAGLDTTTPEYLRAALFQK